MTGTPIFDNLAANLSPTEAAKVAAFGMFMEEEVQRDIDGLEVAECRYCDEQAAWQFSHTCCGNPWFVCDDHAHEERDCYERLILASKYVRCTKCRVSFPHGAQYHDVIREVAL